MFYTFVLKARSTKKQKEQSQPPQASITSTPARPPASQASITSTPTRSSNRKCQGDCNHSDISGFDNQFGNGEFLTYFHPSYLAKHPNFPNVCGECDKKFCLKRRAECDHTEWGVKDSKVYLCKIAANANRADCKYALCSDCAQQKSIHTPRSRTRAPSLKGKGWI